MAINCFGSVDLNFWVLVKVVATVGVATVVATVVVATVAATATHHTHHRQVRRGPATMQKIDHGESGACRLPRPTRSLWAAGTNDRPSRLPFLATKFLLRSSHTARPGRCQY